MKRNAFGNGLSHAVPPDTRTITLPAAVLEQLLPMAPCRIIPDSHCRSCHIPADASADLQTALLSLAVVLSRPSAAPRRVRGAA